jgi:putative acetyltransferase
MIRPYREQDIDRVVEVWHAASLVATPFLSSEFLAAEKARIRDVWMSAAESWVFERDGEIVGFIALVGDEVGGIFVHPDSQRMGVGRALMDHAAIRRARLVLDVFEGNRVGRGFYGRYGFEEIGRSVHEETGEVQIRLAHWNI